MKWQARLSWALLALLAALVGWRLTYLITHVDRGAASAVEIVFDEIHPAALKLTLDMAAFQREFFEVPRIVIPSSGEAVLVVGSKTRSVALANVRPEDVSCSFTDRIYRSGSMPLLTEESAITGRPVPLLAAPATERRAVLIAIPGSLHRALARADAGYGAIRCRLSRSLAAAPTFTDRSITVRARNGSQGAVILDVSALEDIDNLRFSGGVAMPGLGDRARLLTPANDVVSVEWDDISAQETRDILLVVIGALAAIGAALAIEAIRPFIER